MEIYNLIVIITHSKYFKSTKTCFFEFSFMNNYVNLFFLDIYFLNIFPAIIKLYIIHGNPLRLHGTQPLTTNQYV